MLLLGYEIVESRSYKKKGLKLKETKQMKSNGLNMVKIIKQNLFSILFKFMFKYNMQQLITIKVLVSSINLKK